VSTPPAVRIWHIPTQVQAVGAGQGKEWTSRQLIPEDRESESTGRGMNSQVYSAESMVPVEPSTEPTLEEGWAPLPDHLRVRFAPEGR
jgi:hypothetical protein